MERMMYVPGMEILGINSEYFTSNIYYCKIHNDCY